MKKIFVGYYRPSTDQFTDLWNRSIVILDASVLLDLYRYSQNTRVQFLEILNRIADRLWLPHQAALEYQDNRLRVIREQQKTYRDLGSVLGDAEIKLGTILGQEHPSIDGKRMLAIIEESFSKIRKNLEEQEKEHPDLFHEDVIREKLSELYVEKIGTSYSQDQINEIAKQGVKRFENRVPPGYKDNPKGKTLTYGNLVIEAKYGDLILWCQIIEKAKKDGKPAIFVTSDRKEDWWWRDEEERTIGPRPELVTEMLSEAEQAFYIYTPDQFVKYAKEYLGTEVTQEAIDEVRTITESKMEGLVESSTESLQWLSKIRDVVGEQVPDLEYGISKYWAFFKSPEKGRNVVQLNPRKSHIRLFTRLDPSMAPVLLPTPSSSTWAGLYPSFFFVRSDKDIEEAVNLIVKSYELDLTL